MASGYPNSIDNFTDPSGTSLITSPDHAGLHTDVNDAIFNIETALGTTAGTSVLKNIPAGKFAAIDNGGTLTNTTLNAATAGTPRITGGTASAFLLGTSTVQGGTVASAVIGTPTVAVGSDAQGDIYYRSSGGGLARLGPGTSGQVLKTQGAAANPLWGNLKQVVVGTIGTATINTSSTTYTDVTGLAGTITTSANTTLVIMTKIGAIHSNATNDNVQFIIDIDGTDEGSESVINYESPSGGAAAMTLSGIHVKTGLSAAQHVVKVQWKATIGTAGIGRGYAGSELILLEI